MKKVHNLPILALLCTLYFAPPGDTQSHPIHQNTYSTYSATSIYQLVFMKMKATSGTTTLNTTILQFYVQYNATIQYYNTSWTTIIPAVVPSVAPEVFLTTGCTSIFARLVVPFFCSLHKIVKLCFAFCYLVVIVLKPMGLTESRRQWITGIN